MSGLSDYFVSFTEGDTASNCYEHTFAETAAEMFVEDRYWVDKLFLTHEEEFEVFVRRTGEDRQVKYSVTMDTKPVFYAEEAYDG